VSDEPTSAVSTREHPVGCGVSLHVALAVGRAHPVPPTPCCGNGVHGHSRSGARSDAGLALRAGLHRSNQLQDEASASTEVVSRQVVKERSPLPAVRCIDRGPAPTRKPVEARNEKGPGPCQEPGLCEQSLQGARLGAALSRMHSALVPIKLPTDCRQALVQCALAAAEPLHRGSSTHERDQALDGSAAGGDDCGFHDEAL